jgi:hypothetical protein
MTFADLAARPIPFPAEPDVDAGSAVSTRERVTVRLPLSLHSRLEELRVVTHASNVTEVLKNALLFYDALVRERLKGKDVYVISNDGEKTKYPVFL